jgi:hypothetical protein
MLEKLCTCAYPEALLLVNIPNDTIFSAQQGGGISS